MIEFGSIPDRLKIKRWAISTKGQKIPCQINGALAKSNDPNTWATFEDAEIAYQRNQDKYCGIAYAIQQSDGLVFIDLDDCIDENGNIADWARDIVDTADTYTELSVNKTGLHLIGEADIEIYFDDSVLPKKNIEAYSCKHFMTITGNIFENHSVINKRQAEIQEIIKTYNLIKPKTTPRANNTSIERNRQEIEFIINRELDKAIGKASEGNRHNTGVDLACQLRDNRINYANAEEAMRKYQSMIPEGKEPYPISEALTTLKSVYKDSPREPSYQKRNNPGSNHNNTDKSNKVGDPVKETKEADTSFRKHNAELKAIISKHDLKTDKDKKSAEIEAKAYIDQITNPNISGKLIATLNDSLGDSKYEKAKYIYTDDTGRAVFSHGKLADELMSEHDFICVDGVLYVYQNGVYMAIGNSFVETECQKRLNWSARNTRINEVISYIKRCKRMENNTLNTHKYLINLENGMYDIINDKLLEHSTEYLSTTRIPVKYDPSADSSIISDWLASILVDADCIQLVSELFGYCMIPDTTMKKAWMLVGVSNTGKSTLIRVLENFIGADNVSKIPLQEISDSRFKRAELFGKLVNVFADLDKKPLKSTSYFKTIVSGDSIDAERKCQDPFFFRPFVRLVFSANEIPTSSDTSTAYFNRWNIINFDVKFEGANDKKGFADELSKPVNLSALLNSALYGLKSVLNRRAFTVTEKGKKALADYQKQNDPVGAFVETCCKLGDPAARVIRGDLFIEYCKYCEEYEFNACKVTEFYQRVRMLKGVKDLTNDNGKRLFTGIKLLQ